MNSEKMVYWHNGLFLKPHHFQYMQLYMQNMIRDLNNSTSKYNWGLIEFELDKFKLNSYELDIKNGVFFFKDGTIISYPKNAVVTNRSFSEAIKNKSSLKCYIGIKKLSIYESNVTELEIEQSEKRIDTRFIFNREKSLLVNNLYEDNDKVDMLYLDHYLKIFFEDEIDSISDYELLPIALIENKEGNITLSKTYTAPSINIFTNGNIENLLNDIYKYLFSHVNKLEEYKTPYDYKSANLNISKQLIALQAIAEFVPILEAYISIHKAHPWEIYMTLIKLASKLSVFTNRVNVKGIDKSGNILLKEYNHEDIFSCFYNIKELIFTLLDDITIGPDKISDFIYKDDTYYTNISKEYLTDEYNFYISVQNTNIEDFVNSIGFTKISNSKNIIELVARSLPGLEFDILNEPPIGLPKEKTTVYIKLKTNSDIWLDIKSSQDISIFFNDFSEEAKVQLIIIKK